MISADNIRTLRQIEEARALAEKAEHRKLYAAGTYEYCNTRLSSALEYHLVSGSKYSIYIDPDNCKLLEKAWHRGASVPSYFYRHELPGSSGSFCSPLDVDTLIEYLQAHGFSVKRDEESVPYGYKDRITTVLKIIISL